MHKVFAVAMGMKLMMLVRAIRLRRTEIDFEEVTNQTKNIGSVDELIVVGPRRQ